MKPFKHVARQFSTPAALTLLSLGRVSLMSEHGDRIGRGGRVFPIAGLVMALVVPAAIVGAAPVASAVSSTSCGPAVASGTSFVVTCSNTGSEQTFSVPPGVTSLHVVAVGRRRSHEWRFGNRWWTGGDNRR